MVNNNTQYPLIIRNKNLFDKQKKFCNSDYRYTLYSGGVRSGKTVAGCWRAIQLATRATSNGAIGNQTIPQAKKTTQRRFHIILMEIQNKIRKAGLNTKFFEYNKTDRVYTFQNGSEIHFFSYDDPTKVQGMDLDWFWMDEASTANEAWWDMMPTRLSEKAFDGKHYAMFTTNPSHYGHWIYKYLISDNPDCLTIHTTSWDNLSLPENTVKDYKKKAKINKVVYDRLYEGKWGNLEGLVYENFDEKKHVREFEINNFQHFFMSIDWGFKNPFCCLWIALDGEDNVYIFDEYYQEKRTDADNASMIMNRYRGIDINKIYIDPGAGGAEFKFYLENQYNLYPDFDTINAKKDIESGIMLVNEKMAISEDNKEPSLFIHPRCKNLIQELRMYQFQENRDPDNKETRELPKKVNDHAVDALRYFIYTYFTTLGTEIAEIDDLY